MSTAIPRAPGSSIAWRDAAPTRQLAGNLVRPSTPAMPVLARDRERLARDQARACRTRPALFRRKRRRLGHDSCPPCRRRRGRERHACGDRASGASTASSISAPGRGGFSSCSRRSIGAGSASMPRPTCWRSRGPISTGPASATRRCGSATSTICPSPRNSFDLDHRPPGAALPRRSRTRARRGGAGAPSRRPAAHRRLRAACARVPARAPCPSPARLSPAMRSGSGSRRRGLALDQAVDLAGEGTASSR